MTIVLHIGTHKTGTTAIQHFASSNRALLRERGLWYPSYQEVGLFGHYAHHHLAHAIAEESGNKLSLADAKRFVRFIEETKRPGETVLISAEPFYRHLLPAEGGYWACRRAYVQRVREIFPNKDVKVLCVLRRQDGFARSLYQERVKAKKYRFKFRDFLVKERGHFEYYAQLKTFHEAFGAVQVQTYESLARTGLIDSFFELLGVEVAGVQGRPSANQSLPIEYVEFKRILNTTTLNIDRLREIGALLLERAGDAASHERGKLDWIPSAEMSAFLDSFAEDNERLRVELASDLPSPLFPPLAKADPADEPAVYRGMGASRFAQLATDLLLEPGRTQSPLAAS